MKKFLKIPVQSNIQWSDIEKLLIALGAEISEGRGSRIRIALNDVRAVSSSSSEKRKLIKEQ